MLACGGCSCCGGRSAATSRRRAGLHPRHPTWPESPSGSARLLPTPFWQPQNLLLGCLPVTQTASNRSEHAAVGDGHGDARLPVLRSRPGFCEGRAGSHALRVSRARTRRADPIHGAVAGRVPAGRMPSGLPGPPSNSPPALTYCLQRGETLHDPAKDDMLAVALRRGCQSDEEL